MNNGDNWGGGDEEADFEMDGAGMSQEEAAGSEMVERPGFYHFEVADVVPDLDTVSEKGKEKSPCYRFDLVVMESVKGQAPAGSRLYQRVYVAGSGGKPQSDGGRKMTLRWGLGMGLLKEATIDGQPAIVDAVTGLTKINKATWMRGKGMQICAKVEAEKRDKDDPESRVDWRIPFNKCYQVDDPMVADVPKNKDALALIGKAVPKPPAAPKAAAPAKAGGAKPATPAKPAAPPAGEKVDQFADL